MKLVCSDYSEERKGARFKGWEKALLSPRFAIVADDRLIVDCDMGTPATTQYTISLDGQLRTIPRKELQPTARLYCDAQRLRHTLATAGVMLIRPIR